MNVSRLRSTASWLSSFVNPKLSEQPPYAPEYPQTRVLKPCTSQGKLKISDLRILIFDLRGPDATRVFEPMDFILPAVREVKGPQPKAGTYPMTSYILRGRHVRGFSRNRTLVGRRGALPVPGACAGHLHPPCGRGGYQIPSQWPAGVDCAAVARVGGIHAANRQNDHRPAGGADCGALSQDGHRIGRRRRPRVALAYGGADAAASGGRAGRGPNRRVRLKSNPAPGFRDHNLL